MQSQDLKHILENAKFVHLHDAELDAYRESESNHNDLMRARAHTHLQLCRICELRLEQLTEEKSEIAHLEMTANETGPAVVEPQRPTPPPQEAYALARLHAALMVTFAVARLSRRSRRVQYRTKSSRLYQDWRDQDGFSCILSEDKQSFLFTVDTTEASHNGAVVHFALVEHDTQEERASGLLVLHPDPVAEGRYVASVRLGEEVILPEQCQPRLKIVARGTPFNPDELSTAVHAARDEADLQAWHEWAKQEEQAGRLPSEVAATIYESAI
ncbi:MAG: hypothetical protein AB7G75_11000 [Candidatus Binatia bacterium]